MQNYPNQWKEHDQKIQPYLWSHRVLRVASSLLALFLLIWGLGGGRFQGLESFLAPLTPSPFLQWVLYFGALFVGWEILTFSFSVGHHWIERSFHLSKQGYGAWFVDRLKGYGVGGVIGFIALGILYVSVEHFGPNWWAVACTLFVALSIVLAQLAPVLLIPIFFKLKPMEPGPLKERLLKLSERFGVHVLDVYHLGMGEKTEKGNAAFVGLGKTKRIMIGDTLYEKFSPEEVEAVFAHELGHQVHQDLWKGIFVSAFLMYATFYVANELALGWLFTKYDTNLVSPFGMFLFFVLLSFIQMATGFLQSLFSRSCEWAADKFAQEKTGSGEKLAAALERLTYQNHGQFKPNSLIEFFTYSHPAPWRRITKLRS